jgi:hypothetical protein
LHTDRTRGAGLAACVALLASSCYRPPALSGRGDGGPRDAGTVTFDAGPLTSLGAAFAFSTGIYRLSTASDEDTCEPIANLPPAIEVAVATFDGGQWGSIPFIPPTFPLVPIGIDWPTTSGAPFELSGSPPECPSGHTHTEVSYASQSTTSLDEVVSYSLTGMSACADAGNLYYGPITDCLVVQSQHLELVELCADPCVILQTLDAGEGPVCTCPTDGG